jgi:hypothetical protein
MYLIRKLTLLSKGRVLAERLAFRYSTHSYEYGERW